MTEFRSYRHFILLWVFYIVSLCQLLSWAEDVPVLQKLDNSSSSENITFNASVSNINVQNSVNDKTPSASDSVVEQNSVQPSLEEIAATNKHTFQASQAEFTFTDVASQNSGLSNEITDTGQPLVFTLADTATAELQQRADIPSAITSHNNETPNLIFNNYSNKQATFTETNAETENVTTNTVSTPKIPNANTETNAEEKPEIESKQKTEQIKKIELDASVEAKDNTTDNTEDIPSFSEWAQKQLEEAEKKRELVNTSSQINNVNGKSSGSGKRSKNYASLDCGAKVVSTNPEAVSSSSVLSGSRDEYMLNACTNRIWFIVELCEAIQAKKIDLANFELFSSLPKEFSIYVSDRYPSRDWLNVGHFTAKEDRDVQTFDLHPQLFGKFVKFEMHSHYGSEHYCPISLFRVYGTSEFEVLEKENEAHTTNEDDDGDDDEDMDSDDNGQTPKNLFSSATDVVISMVKKAAEVLGNKGNNSNFTDGIKIQENYAKIGNQCKTPSHIIVCDNCSDVLYDDVYELLSCKSDLLSNLLKCDLVQNTLFTTDTCSQFGLNFRLKRSTVSKLYNQFIRATFTKRYLAALCNTAAILDNKVVLNISKQFPNTTEEIPKDFNVIETVETPTIPENKKEEVKATEELKTVDKIVETSIPNEVDASYTSQIKPTKALTPDNNINTHISPETKDDKTVQPLESLEGNQENVTQIDSGDLEENLGDFEVVTEMPEDIDLINEFNNLGSVGGSPSAPPIPSIAPQVKETVILRLSNRIKALERNMSLSGQYLEELSRRYKKQVEEIQKLLDKTIVTLSEEGKRHDERIQKLENQIDNLTLAVKMLVDEKNSWLTSTYWLFLLLIMLCCFFTFCGGKKVHKSPGDEKNSKVQRRKSIDVINHVGPPKKMRRPSEEASLRITGTYKDLMKDEIDFKKRIRERKRKRKRSLATRSNSIGTLIEEIKGMPQETENRKSALENFQPAFTSSKMWNRQQSSPSNFPDWESNNLTSEIDDLPFVLEESENSPLESLPLPKPLQTEVKTNGNITEKMKNVPIFLKTASEVRTKRKQTSNGKKKELNGASGHRKSGSLDETTRKGSPTPSIDTGSLNISYDEVKKTSSTQKKDRKGAIKRILKKVFPSDV